MHPFFGRVLVCATGGFCLGHTVASLLANAPTSVRWPAYAATVITGLCLVNIINWAWERKP